MIHKTMTLIALLGFIWLECSCNPRNDTDIRKTIETFIVAWQQHDIPMMERLYPEVKQMDYFYSSDRAVISDISNEEGNALRVRVNSTFVTDNQQEVERKITFVITPDTHHQGCWNIRDSYGLACWDRYPYYKFALRTGCIPRGETTGDVELSRRMTRAKQMVFIYTQALYDHLSEEVQIIENNMTRNDGKQSEGVAIVRNDSEFHLPNLKYSIIFYDEGHKEVGRTNGWVTQEVLPAGEMCAFRYATPIAQGASIMYFVLDFDVEMIVDYILEYQDYDGSEYGDFMERKDKASTSPTRQAILKTQ